MTETVVHVTTLEQWKSVLDVWFEQGYVWFYGNKGYLEDIFENGGRFLFLDDYITWSASNHNSEPFIEYSEFMEQQKEDNKMETYYVTQEQLDLIEELKFQSYPMFALAEDKNNRYTKITNSITELEEKALLRYLGGDTSIKFKVKEQLYRLWRVDDDGEDMVYMHFSYGTPDWTMNKDVAFTAPLEEIKKWNNPAWEIEKAD